MIFIVQEGTRIILVHKPNFECLPVNIDAIREAYIDTLAMADEVREIIGLKVQVVLGPHPVSWVHQISSMGMEAATKLHLDAVDSRTHLFRVRRLCCRRGGGSSTFPGRR